jgi:hypothetical protein
MTAGRSLVLVLGIVVLVGNAASVTRVLIVPRPSASGPSTWSARVIRFGFRQFAGLTRTYVTKDRVLALSEPVALLGLLATWLVISVIGFGLVVWGLNDLSISGAFAQSGSSVFTLGFDTDRHTGGRAVDFVAAATGMVLVALQIAYLPTLYGAYNRRETLVTLLEARAGAPAWGPEVLIRHQLVGLIGNLPALFADWEQWSADVTESHTSYPSLLYFRSPRSQNSWIVSIIAVMDAAALSLALDPDGAPREARMCVRMGFTCLRDIAQVSRVDYDPDPSPDADIALPRSEFDAAVARLDEIGYPITRSPDEAWAHFKGWRVNYESTGYALAALVEAPPARWTGPRRLFHGESLEPARPIDRQPRGAPPGVFSRKARTILPTGDPPWTGRPGPGNRPTGEGDDQDRSTDPGPST